MSDGKAEMGFHGGGGGCYLPIVSVPTASI